jgi:hypothetical protein
MAGNDTVRIVSNAFEETLSLNDCTEVEDRWKWPTPIAAMILFSVTISAALFNRSSVNPLLLL